jgi:hypothetical protein
MTLTKFKRRDEISIKQKSPKKYETFLDYSNTSDIGTTEVTTKEAYAENPTGKRRLLSLN